MSTMPIGPSGVETIEENLPEGQIETADYTTRRLAPIGKYASNSRAIVITDKIGRPGTANAGKPFLSVQITFDGGLSLLSNGMSFGTGQYPFKTWVTSILFQKRNPDGSVQPGKTSSLAEYLRAAKFDPKALVPQNGDPFGAVREALLASQQVPVGVRMGWGNKTSKDPLTGDYGKRVLYSKSFNTGTKDNPVWSTRVTVNGVEYEAREEIEGFFKL